MVSSGHGLQPYWVVEDGDITDEFGTDEAKSLSARFGRLVAAVAKERGVTVVDTVSDIARVLRTPDTVNLKSDPVRATLRTDTGGPLGIGEIDERLTEQGIDAQPDDTTDDKVRSDPNGWTFGAQTCAYMRTLITGLVTDGPKVSGGPRNPWACSQAVRLCCAWRLGCITEADFVHAHNLLEARLRALLENTEPRRRLRRYEMRDIFNLGRKRAAVKTDEAARAELGSHDHGPTVDDFFGTQATSGTDDDEQQATTMTTTPLFNHAGLRALTAAEAVMQSVTCGFGTIDQRFYVYDRGVWLPNNGIIEAEIARLLGNRYRHSHARNILDMVRYAPSTPRLTGEPLSEFINVPNGMLDWRTRGLRDHSPDYHSTVQLPVEYDEHATCPRFERFLAEVLPKDCYEPAGDSPGFIWEVIGYTLYSGNPLHIAVLLLGSGRNGKGVLIRVLKRLLGARNCTTVRLHDLIENRFRAATLFGKLANLAGDLDSTLAGQHGHLQSGHRRRHRSGRGEIRRRIRLHPVGAAVLLGQQTVRVGRLLGGLGGALGGGAVPQQLHRARGPGTRRTAADRRRAPWHPAPQRGGPARADGPRTAARTEVGARRARLSSLSPPTQYVPGWTKTARSFPTGSRRGPRSTATTATTAAAGRREAAVGPRVLQPAGADQRHHRSQTARRARFPGDSVDDHQLLGGGVKQSGADGADTPYFPYPQTRAQEKG